MEFLDYIKHETLFGIDVWRYVVAGGILLLALLLKRVFAHIFSKLAFPFAAKTDTIYDDLFLDAIKKPLELLFVIAGVFIGIQFLQLPPEPAQAQKFAHGVIKMLLTIDVAWALYNMVTIVEAFLGKMVSSTESDLDDHLLPFVRKFLRIFVVVIAVLVGVQNLGFSIAGVVASLGIGGLAVALAAKDTLANVFGSFMIIADRPFHIGDAIKSGDIEGKVEEVGFRSTKVRTLDKTLISIPNSIITNLAVNNLSRITQRRVRFTLGLTYATKPEQLRTAVERIRILLQSDPRVDKDGLLVHFTDFGASSLDILVQYFTVVTAMPEHLPVREELSLRIMEILAELKLELAFPSRTVYLQGGDGETTAAAGGK
ncbi:MAG: mechanosensitive ion channel protein MscS [Desulfuromonadales bacterium GWD2_61_12]|nr:MAG: mechanosensitive ion channel protein MscS [Desulfuromonadales bacterium GWC2_61_20]OGR36180.1 MAG: mechanosensitive ion channel protein MscS [Desulfuromonadales bacterium GWD2_61_12]HAD03803.1 mechanosensitive ion channel family protein [Desulfuromonas sp.]HBT82092.1 mechanosensitive ion channel family protein [Desulfuromonas sp.]